MPKMTLAAARVNAGYTQFEAAKLSGYSISTIRSWEQGKTFPKQPAIEKLSELYGVPYDQLDFSKRK